MKEFLDQVYQNTKFLQGMPVQLWYAIGIFLVGFVIVNFVAVFAGLCTLMERKIAGHMQHRVGPYRVGPHGSLQWLADALKLILKEDIVPASADRLLYKAAPIVVFAGSFACWLALPYWQLASPGNLNIGILYILAASASVVIGILMAGWASGSKWALFGAMRSAAQIVSYEVPVGLTLLGMLLLSGSLNMHDITAGQEKGFVFGLWPEWSGGVLSWNLFRYPPFTLIAFLVYFTAALAETNRTPFDIPEAESELVAGYHTEYSGFRFSVFFLAEYANMFVVAAIATTFFLGGWLPPFGHALGAFTFLGEVLEAPWMTAAEGAFWFFIKCFALLFLMMWLRWTLPRYRVDQLMDLCWKKLTPLAFVNFAAIGLSSYNPWIALALGGVGGLALLKLIADEILLRRKVSTVPT